MHISFRGSNHKPTRKTISDSKKNVPVYAMGESHGTKAPIQDFTYLTRFQTRL